MYEATLQDWSKVCECYVAHISVLHLVLIRSLEVCLQLSDVR